MNAEPRRHLPRAEDFLLWPPTIQPYGYRIVDQLFAHRVIRRGETATPLPRTTEIAPRYLADGAERDVGAFMDCNFIAGLLVLKDGAIVLERYGLGLQEHDRWSTMSTIKSMTAMLVGAAAHDGAIASIDADISTYLPELRGSAYDGVTLRHVLTMSSGVRWNEDYTDRNSDVNRYSKSMADRAPGGVLKLMASLPRAVPGVETPGCRAFTATGSVDGCRSHRHGLPLPDGANSSRAGRFRSLSHTSAISISSRPITMWRSAAVAVWGRVSCCFRAVAAATAFARSGSAARAW